MEQNLLELFKSKNKDDIKLAFLIAKQTDVPIEEVNLAFGNIPKYLVEETVLELTDYNPNGEHPNIGRDETGLMRHRYITKWKEDETSSNI